MRSNIVMNSFGELSVGSNLRAARKTKRRGPLFGVVSKSGELCTFVSNQAAIDASKNVDPVLSPIKSFYDDLHADGYFFNLQHKLASKDLGALNRFCSKLPADAYFNGYRIYTPRLHKTVDEQENVDELLEEQREALDGRVSHRATIADHVQTLVPKSRREL